jgi:hypothetical protein
VGALFQAYQAALGGASVGDLQFPTEALELGPILRETEEPYWTPQPGPPTPRRARTRGRNWLAPILVLLLGAGVWLARPWWEDSLRDFLRTFSAPPTVVFLVTEPAQEQATATSQPSPTPLQPMVSPNCPGLAIWPPSLEGNRVTWQVENDTDTAQRLILLQPTFPEINERLMEVTLGEEIISQGEVDGAMGLLESAERVVPPHSIAPLSLRFEYSAAQGGYALQLAFEGGCRLEGEWQAE